MGKTQVKVLHIDSEKNWRGGQQQVAYLHEALHKNEFTSTLVCQPDSSLEKYCLEHTLPYYPISMKGELDFFAGFKIALICRKKRYNILHLHSSHALATGLWAKLFFRKLKLIAVRRVDFHIKKNRFSQLKYHTNMVNNIVCISDAIRNVLISDGVLEDKLITIHSGINIHKFDQVKINKNFKTNLNIPEKNIIVGTIAALTNHKDYPNLLKAANIVLQKLNNVTFIALGDGPQKEKIHQFAKDLNLKNNFIFTGFRKDIGQFLKMFDIFVLASKLEGLGTAILDAQAVGLPIIACKTGGIPEAVIHNKNGLLVSPENEKQLAEAISKLIKHVDLRKKFGKNSLEFVKNFDIKKTIQKNINLYETILN